MVSSDRPVDISLPEESDTKVIVRFRGPRFERKCSSIVTYRCVNLASVNKGYTQVVQSFWEFGAEFNCDLVAPHSFLMLTLQVQDIADEKVWARPLRLSLCPIAVNS